MPKIRYLKIRFDQDIIPYDIPRFRAAVIEKTERASDLFHNHDGETKFKYRYPLIQYKITHRKASIVCLNSGSDDIHYLLQNRDMHLRVGRDVSNYSIEDVQMRYHNVQVWQHVFDFSLKNWLALNQRHHERFSELEGDEAAQIELLKSILRGNILAFAKGIDWYIEEEVKVAITKIKDVRSLPFKKGKMLGFNLNFQTNVSLPDYIGLGKGSSLGFGVVKRFYDSTENSSK